MQLSYSAKVNFNIERKARGMGMIYPDEINVIQEKGRE